MKKSYLGGIIAIFLILNISLVLGDVFINEFVVDPNVVYTTEWIELYNNDTGVVNLTGWSINDTLTNPSVILTIADDTLIQSDDYLVFDLSSKLNNAGDTILLIDNLGVVIDQYTYTLNPGNDVSIGRKHDGLSTWIDFTSPTPNATNNRLPTGDILNQTIDEDVSGYFDVSSYITDADNDALTFTIIDDNVNEVDCNIINDTNVTLTPYGDWNGVANCTIRADDSYGTVNKSFYIHVDAVNDAPVISGVPNQIATEDVNLVLNVTSYISDVDNATSELTITENSTYATVIGKVITFNYPNGVLEEDVTITVSDGTLTNEQNITVTVTAVNDAPTINVIADQDVNEDDLLQFPLTGGDIDSGDTLTYSCNLTVLNVDNINNTLANVTWTPTNEYVGKHTVNCTIMDLAGEKDSDTFIINVTNTNDAPVLSAIGDRTAIESIPFTFILSATDEDPTNDVMDFTTNATVGDFDVNSTTGLVTFNPVYADVGVYDVFFQITDGNGGQDNETITLTVKSALEIPELDVIVDLDHAYPLLNNGDVIEARPGSVIAIALVLENMIDINIRGINGSAIINSDLGLVDYTEELWPLLNSGEQIWTPFVFQLPHLLSNKIYSLNILAEGTDDNYNTRIVERTIYVNVTKELTDMIITSTEITPNEISCVRNGTLSVNITNIGLHDQTNVEIDITNEELGIDITDTIANIALNTTYEYTKVFDTIADMPGTHRLNIEVTYFFTNKTTANVDLMIGECIDVPDYTTIEDDQLITIDLETYTTDPNYFDNEFTYAVEDVSNGLLASCVVTQNRYVNCTAAGNQTGYSDINVSVTKDLHVNYDVFRLTLTGVNDAPIAHPPYQTTVDEDSSVLIEFNCSDIDGDALTYNITGDSNYGILSGSGSSRTYTPDANYNGPDFFLIQCSDGMEFSEEIYFSITVNPTLDKPSITSRDPEEESILIGDGKDEDLEITVSNPDNTTYEVNWYVNGVLNVTDTLHPSDEYEFKAEVGEDDTDVDVKIENLAGTEVYDEFEWEFSVKLVPETDYEGTIGDVTESDVSNFTDLTIIKSNVGKIDFGNQTIDLSDVVNVDPNVIIEHGVVGIDTESLEFDVFETTPATITMYGLTSASTPAIYYNDLFTTTGTDVCNAGTDPACTNIVYDASTGTLVFDVSHFTVFFLNNPPVITSTAITTAIVNEAYSYQVTATDSESDPLTYSLTTKPSGMTISSTGLIGWNPVNITTGNVTVSVSDGTNTAAQSFEIDVNEGPKFVISDLDMKVGGESVKNLQDGDKIEEDAKPGDKVKFDIELENLFSTDIEIQDIEVIVTIENIDDSDDLEEEETMDDIEDGDHDSVTLDFTIPTLVEDGEYNIIIEVDAEDENGKDQDIRWELTLEVKKDKHDLIIDNADLNPSLVRCNRNPTLDIEVINIGRDDEDDVSIKISNDDLGIDIEEEDIELEEGDNDDSVFEKTYRLKISDNVKSGTYPISVKTYYDGKKSDEKTVDLIIGKCIDTVTPLEREQVDVITTTDKVIKPAEPTVTTISFKDTSYYITLLVIVFIILLGGAVFLVGAMVILMKK